MASGRVGRDGTTGCFLPVETALRFAGGAAAFDSHSRGDLLPRVTGFVRTGGGTGPASGVRRNACGARRVAVRSLERQAGAARPLGEIAGTDQILGPAQLADDRHCADRDDRLDLRLL